MHPANPYVTTYDGGRRVHVISTKACMHVKVTRMCIRVRFIAANAYVHLAEPTPVSTRVNHRQDQAALSIISHMAGLPCLAPKKTDWSSLQHQRDGNLAGTLEYAFCRHAGLVSVCTTHLFARRSN